VDVMSLATAVGRDGERILGLLRLVDKADGNPFTALNGAFLTDGAYVSVAEGVVVDRPIHLVFVSQGTGESFAVHPRALLLAAAGSRVSIIESHVGVVPGTYFANAVTQILLGERAAVDHASVVADAPSAYRVGSTYVSIGTESRFTSSAITLDGALVRNSVTAVFAGNGGECTLNGLTLAGGTQVVDNHTTIDHAYPGCVSHELYKAVLDGRTRGVFNGKIMVRRDAQQTDAKQTNRTLLLSDDASIHTKPQLEIFADDVKCTHGAAVGQLDEEQVFYLRSRGIGEGDARELLTFAFAEDIIARVTVPALREQLDAILRRRLREGRIVGGGSW
jgi:Fe-S cluster assembly protein SufD